MEFLGVGPLELLVILVIALLVVGPQRLPEIAAQMGRFMRTFQRYTSQITREFNETMHDLEREYNEVKGDWRDVGQGLDESARSVSDELRAAGQDARLPPPEPPPTSDGPQQTTARPPTSDGPQQTTARPPTSDGPQQTAAPPPTSDGPQQTAPPPR